MENRIKYLNLGCGSRFCPDWTNVDLLSFSRNVKARNLLKGIPFPDNSFELVYHSHFLEHLDRQSGRALLAECRRVLMPGGVLRVVVPDLEFLAKEYMKNLDSVRNCKDSKGKYDWALLNFLDQMVRKTSGGEMKKFLQNNPEDLEYITQTGGKEVLDIIESGKAHESKLQMANRLLPKLVKLMKHSPKFFFLQIANPLNYFYKFFQFLLLTNRDYQALKQGKFRLSGEVHQWMYDKYSLTELLKALSFDEIEVFSATTSNISNWLSYNLDTEPDGSIYKPGSVYIEARKP